MRIQHTHTLTEALSNKSYWSEQIGIIGNDDFLIELTAFE